MKKNNKIKRIATVAIILLAIFLFFDFSFNIDLTLRARASTLNTDPVNDEIDIEIISGGFDPTLTGGYPTAVTVQATNLENREAKFLVECGVYDTEKFSFARQSLVNDAINCKVEEDFVDTKYVQLSGKESKKFTLSIPKVPNKDSEYVLRCQAYERCWTPEIDPFVTGSDTRSVIVSQTKIVDEPLFEFEDIETNNFVKRNSLLFIIGGIALFVLLFIMVITERRT